MSAVISEPMPFIRSMHADDLAAVMQVEKSAYAHPWSEGILLDCLRVGYSCWVCELGDELIGHAVMSMAVGEAHLLNICVRPDQQSRGIGRRLLRRALRVAADRSVDTVFLEVRESNESARQLYETEGFCEIGRRHGYYPLPGSREDALVYARALL